MESLAQMYWEVTCNFCIKVRNVMARVFEKIISVFETMGRARAAAQLANMGYHKEAKTLMLNHKNK